MVFAIPYTTICVLGKSPTSHSFLWLDCPALLWLLCCLFCPSQHGRALTWCITMCWISRAWSVWAAAAASLGPRAARTFQRTQTMTVYGRLTLTGWGRFPVRAAAPTSPTRIKFPHLYYFTSFTLVYLFYLFWCLFIFYLFIIFMSFHLPVLNHTPCPFGALIQIGPCCLDTFLTPVILMSPHEVVGENAFCISSIGIKKDIWNMTLC